MFEELFGDQKLNGRIMINWLGKNSNGFLCFLGHKNYTGVKVNVWNKFSTEQ